MMITLREEGPLHGYSMLSIFFITFLLDRLPPLPPETDDRAVRVCLLPISRYL
jgi:hypothetical protein